MKSFALGLFGLLAAANLAHAAPVMVGASSPGAIVQVGEGCGPGAWRGPYGGCHAFVNGFGSNRGTRFECPPAMHFASGRCYPNQ